MNSNYEMVLGIEIHMQLSSEMKMFCTCKNDPFKSEPNTNVCPVCLGLPGALPVANPDAIKRAQKMAAALGGNLNKQIIFERKNYFYPDLAKGFQLTCPHYPISTAGQMDLSLLGVEYPIRWREIHLEEDTGKSTHSDKTYLDFNKSGVPLLEMVTEPDFKTIEDAVIFCKEIQLLARTLGISEADMEKGHMRLEANVSVRKVGETELPNYRVELKNINSFGFMKKALEYEVKRQSEELEKGTTLYQETRGFNEASNSTFVQRSKEDANDYRYFPEPDIPPVEFADAELAEVSHFDVLLPNTKRKNLLDKKVSANYVAILVEDNDLYSKVLELIEKHNIAPQKACSLYIDQTNNRNLSPEEIAKKENEKSSNVISDKSQIEKIVDEVLSENPKSIEDFKNGKDSVLQFLMGQGMKKSQGKADVATLKEMLLTKMHNTL